MVETLERDVHSHSSLGYRQTAAGTADGGHISTSFTNIFPQIGGFSRGHNRTPSACSAISFTSSILSEPISENDPYSEPETDSRGYEIVHGNKVTADTPLPDNASEQVSSVVGGGDSEMEEDEFPMSRTSSYSVGTPTNREDSFDNNVDRIVTGYAAVDDTSSTPDVSVDPTGMHHVLADNMADVIVSCMPVVAINGSVETEPLSLAVSCSKSCKTQPLVEPSKSAKCTHDSLPMSASINEICKNPTLKQRSSQDDDDDNDDVWNHLPTQGGTNGEIKSWYDEWESRTFEAENCTDSAVLVTVDGFQRSG